MGHISPPPILSSPAEVGHTTATATTQTTSPQGHHSLQVMMCLLRIQINKMQKLKLNHCLCCKRTVKVFASKFFESTQPLLSTNIDRCYVLCPPLTSRPLPWPRVPAASVPSLVLWSDPATTLPRCWQSSSGQWRWK